MKLEILDSEGNIIGWEGYVKGIITLRMESYKPPSYDFRKCSISFHDRETDSFIEVFHAKDVGEGAWELQIDTNTLEDNRYIVNFILCNNMPNSDDCGVVYDGIQSQWKQNWFTASNEHCGDYIFKKCRGSTGIYSMDCGGWIPYMGSSPPLKEIRNDPNCVTVDGGNGNINGENGGIVPTEKPLNPLLIFGVVGTIMAIGLISIYFVKRKKS